MYFEGYQYFSSLNFLLTIENVKYYIVIGNLVRTFINDVIYNLAGKLMKQAGFDCSCRDKTVVNPMVY